MNKKLWLLVLAVVVLAGLAIIVPCLARGGEMAPISGYKVLAPIRHGNLTIFPVVAAMSHDTQQFLTLDEGLRSGEVIVTESGNAQPLVRPRHQHSGPIMDGRPSGGAQVNQLVLINNSQRPLILLAGEIVAGGHQDRVIGKDRIVPAESDPIDLSVFCVEPGRWTGPTSTFGGGVGSGGAIGAGMAQPAVRSKAMVDKDQAKVWAEVGKAKESVSYGLSAPAASAVAETSSYARVMQNGEVKQKVDALAAPMQQDYQSLIQQLRDRKAVGVVVAVNGEIIWADIFASTDLLEKYWPKLVRSYAAEAVSSSGNNHDASEKTAQQFLEDTEGRHEIAEIEPGLYRHTEVTGDGFKAFELTSLLPKTGFDLHVAKMAD
ncbi:MAG: DUF6569 family protein [Terriglobales bacterium]|jgi:hypothetical protein